MCFSIEFRFQFGSSSVKKSYFGFSEISFQSFTKEIVLKTCAKSPKCAFLNENVPFSNSETNFLYPDA